MTSTSKWLHVTLRKRILLTVTLVNIVVFLGYAFLLVPRNQTDDQWNIHRVNRNVTVLRFDNISVDGKGVFVGKFSHWNSKQMSLNHEIKSVIAQTSVEDGDWAKLENDQTSNLKVSNENSSFNGPIKGPHLLDSYPSRSKNYEKQQQINFDMNLYLRSSGWFSRLMRDEITFTVYNYILNSPSFCNVVTNNGSSLPLLVTVLTSVRNVEQRAAVRDTWGRDLESRGAKVLFFLGTDSQKSTSVQSLVQDESRDYGDIVQNNFTDSYYNLSTKAVTMLRWVNQYCSEVKFVLKADDDIFINVDTLYPLLEVISNETSGIWGLLAHNSRPVRNKHSKWFMPQRAYPWTFYPDFIAGPSYVIGGQALTRMLQTAVRMTPFFLEDVFMTGLVAEVAGVPRFNESRMHNLRERLDPCTYNQTITSHYHQPWDLRRRWKSVHDGFFICRRGIFNVTNTLPPDIDILQDS